MDIQEAKKVINKRTERLLEEFKIEKEIELEDEPKIAYLMQEIRANKVVLSELDYKDKENTILRQGLKENTEEIDKLNGIINLMAEQLTTPVHSKKWVIDYFEKKAEGN